MAKKSQKPKVEPVPVPAETQVIDKVVCPNDPTHRVQRNKAQPEAGKCYHRCTVCRAPDNYDRPFTFFVVVKG